MAVASGRNWSDIILRLCVSVFALMCLQTAVGAPSGGGELQFAERFVGHEKPAENAAWEPIKLPQSLGEHVSSDFNEPLHVWFRFDLRLQAQSRYAQALYLPRHNMTAAVYVDDDYVGGTDQTWREQRAIGWNMPLLLDLPDIENSRYLYIRLESGPSGSLLSPVFIGPRSDLQARFDARYFIQITTSKIAFAVCMLMGVLSLWLWLRRREDRLYLRFNLLCLCYCVQTAFGFLEFIPVDLRVWLSVVHTAGSWANYLLVSFVLIALGEVRLRLTQVLYWLAWLSTIVHLVVPDQWFLAAAYALLSFGNVLVYGFGAWVIYRVVRQPLSSDIWFGIAFAGMFIFSAHDFYVVFLSDPEQYAEGVNWMHLSLPLLAIAFYSHLLNRFVTALDTSEVLNRELRVAMEEKQRVYRDLHDDVGSRLLSIIHQGEKGSGQLAREALENIRSTLYSVNHSDETMSQFSDDILQEVELRLTSAGIITDVESDLDRDIVIDASVAYHLKRVIREAVNNILHHAHATFVTTYIRLRDNRLELEVSDDGVGFNADAPGHTGLSNIRFRCEQIGAQYSFADSDDGTSFRVTLDVRGSTIRQTHEAL